MTNPHTKILAILASLRSASNIMVDIYKWGGCYRLFELLRIIFGQGEAFYDENFHVVTKLYGRYYDITGEVFGDFRVMDFVEQSCAQNSCCIVDARTIRPATWLTRKEIFEIAK